MIRINTIALRSLTLFACVLAASSWSGSASATCPDDDPCETLDVYRVQSRMPAVQPPISADAAGRPLVSLQEANANDAIAFRGLLQATPSTHLAIRTNVTRIASRPNDYCNCNLEHANKGCHGGTPLATLRQCTRVCRYGGEDTCRLAGAAPKSDGGSWYAFPAAMQCVGARNKWQRNVIRFDASHCDWRENARVIKGAGCLAAVLVHTPMASLDMLFGPHSPCPDEHL